MNAEYELLRDAVSKKLAKLLDGDELGWREAAKSIDKLALEDGIDLAADFDSAEIFAGSLMEGMRFHADLDDRFPNGLVELERFEVAEELFLHLTPYRRGGE